MRNKAYGTNEILDYIQIQDVEYTIPPKSNSVNPWRYDWCVYKERHLVECFFQKLKNFRRVATRHDKLSTSFLAFVYIASIFILSK
jgi:transposase